MSDDPVLSALARLEAEAGRVSGRLDHLSGGMDNLSGRMDALSGRMDHVSGRMDNLLADQSSFRADMLDELGKTRGVIMEKVADLQAPFTAIRDDIGVNMGGVHLARKANDNTREDMIQMREQMSVMSKQIKAAGESVRYHRRPVAP